MKPIARPSREDPDDRLNRQAAYFRELAEVNMAAARAAGARIQQAGAADGDIHTATLDLSRATHGVVQSVDAENYLFRPKTQPKPAAEAPIRAPASDARRTPLHHAFRQALDAEPDRAARTALGRRIGAAVEQRLVDDPHAEFSLSEHFIALAESLELDIDPSKLSDEILGIPPRTHPRPGAPRFPKDSADTGDP